MSSSPNQNTKVTVNVNASAQNKGYSPHNPALWLRRYARDISDKYAISNITLNSRDVSLNVDLYDLVGVNPDRKKRQSSGRSTLCRTSVQFIMPQAALNNKGECLLTCQMNRLILLLEFPGNWMFVVNEDKSVRQLVKTELCS